MIAKLIVHGADRSEALALARAALDNFSVEGVPTTAEFHRALIDDPDFVANRIHTRWVENVFMDHFANGGVA